MTNKKTTTPITHAPAVTQMLSIDQIHENPWNPNRMNEQQFKAYVAEVRRLRRTPKPIVVRPDGTGFEIVDGEHGFRAAKKVGLTEVCCEVLEADDLEAMRQTFARNQTGTHNRCAEGRMFRAMSKQCGSVRKLAKFLGKPEATLRAILDYSKAAEIRNLAAPNTADDDIDKLTGAELSTYMALPVPIGDRWLDAGATLRMLRPYNNLGYEWIRSSLGSIDLRLGQAVSSDALKFRATLRFAVELSWAIKQLHVEESVDAVEYGVPLVAHGLSLETLDHLPVKLDGHRRQPLLSVVEWRECIQRAMEQRPKSDMFFRELAATVRNALRQHGIDPDTVQPAQLTEDLVELEQAPEEIRAATFLSLTEQLQLLDLHKQFPAEEFWPAYRTLLQAIRSERIDNKGSKPKRAGDGEVTKRMMDLLTTASSTLPPLRPEIGWTFSIMERLQTKELSSAEDILCHLRQRLLRVPAPELALLAAAVGTIANAKPVLAVWLHELEISATNSLPNHSKRRP